MTAHAILLHFDMSDREFGPPPDIQRIQEGEAILCEMLEKSKVGELDGHEYGEGEYTIYIYGEDADAMFGELFPFLASWDCIQEGYAIKRYGPAGARTEQITFKPHKSN